MGNSPRRWTRNLHRPQKPGLNEGVDVVGAAIQQLSHVGDGQG